MKDQFDTSGLLPPPDPVDDYWGLYDDLEPPAATLQFSRINRKGKEVVVGSEARNRLAAGIRILAEAVSATLGPSGRNVLIGMFGAKDPDITKDGVTVASSIELEDAVAESGVRLIREAARQTATKAGDGTTTSTVLANYMINAGLDYMDEVSGANTQRIRKGMQRAKDVAIEVLKDIAQTDPTHEQLKAVTLVSTNHDEELADMILEAFTEVGDHGQIDVQPTTGPLLYKDTSLGYSFDKGYVHFGFREAGEANVKYQNPVIFVTTRPISANYDLLPMLGAHSIISQDRGDVLPLVIIAPDVKGPALEALIKSRHRSGVRVVAIKAPSSGEMQREILEDIAIFVGGKLIDTAIQDQAELVSYAGMSDEIICNDRRTIIYGDGLDEVEEHEDRRERHEAIQARVKAIEAELEGYNETQYGRYYVDMRRKRIARLTGGISVIYVGSPTETESNERFFRAEDAINAIAAAKEEGFVPGGGSAYLKCLAEVEGAIQAEDADFNCGVDLVYQALSQPHEIIMRNAGHTDIDWDEYAFSVLLPESAKGVDATTGEIVDMVEAGIIDPLKVSRLALEHAVSVASTVLTTEIAIVPLPGVVEQTSAENYNAFLDKMTQGR